MIGAATWADYAVAVNATFAPAAAVSAAAAGTSAAAAAAASSMTAHVAACDSSDAAQRWQWNVSGAAYLSSEATGLCLNVDGCAADLIYYECATSVSARGCRVRTHA